jgi:Ca2+-binding EF-hand superfamily protein
MLRRLIPFMFNIMILAMILTTNMAVAQEPKKPNLFERADADKNGMVSKEEWNTAMQKRFEAVDKNKDGVLSQNEWQEMRETVKERRRARAKAQAAQ